MKTTGCFLCAAILLAAVTIPAAEEERTTEGRGLTVYTTPAPPGQQPQYYTNQYVMGRYVQTPTGYAVVKDWRKIDLEDGRNVLRFQDVAKMIEPSTVHFKSLTDPDGTFVVEQNYEYDLVNRQKLLEKYVDREISLPPAPDEENGQARSGKLLSTEGGLILEMDGEIHINPPQPGGIVLPELPGGLITRPTLVWMLDAEQGGEHLVKVTYETKGILWLADYTAVVKDDDKKVDLSAWVTIDNQTGATYEDAEVKLIAGDVHRTQEPGRVAGRAGYEYVAKGAREAAFEEKSFFEYHLYTLGRPTTLKDNSQKQIELFPPVSDVPVKKMYVYFGATNLQNWWGNLQQNRDFGTQSNKDVDIYVAFENTEAAGLGMPLPGGRVRVHKEDEADGSLEFIGEDSIDHTPKDERVLLKLGSAFDVVGERKQTDFRIDTGQNWIDESFEIKIRNHKDEDIEVIVKEVLYRWAGWEIVRKSHNFEKVDSRTVHFPVQVPKDGEVTLTYTVHYSW